MTRVKQIRDDVAAAVGAISAVTARGITPVATSVPPSRDRAEVDAAEIWVAVAGREVIGEGRGVKVETFTVQVAIYDPFTTAGGEETTAEADQVLAEAIIDELWGQRLATGSRAICIRAAQPTLQSVAHWREKRLFTSFVELEYRQ